MKVTTMNTGLEKATSQNSGPIVFQNAVSADVIARLPDAAADKLRILRQRVADLHASIPPFR